MPKVISFKQIRYRWPVYLFVLPSLLLISIFAYYPALNAIVHSFYRWNGSTIEYYVGLKNFRELLGWSPTLWIVVAVWVALMMMTLTGKPAWAKGKVQWVLCAFVMLVGGLIFGAIGELSLVSESNAVIFNISAAKAAAWIAVSLISTLVGVLLYAVLPCGFTKMLRILGVVFGLLWFFDLSMQTTGDKVLWYGFAVIFVLVLANVVKMIPSIATAVLIHRLKSERAQYIYRVLFVVPMIIPLMVNLLVWKFFYDPNQGVLNIILYRTGLMDLLVWVDGLFGWGSFKPGMPPSWLGDVNLVIPSLIFWGFPWIGVVGVLLYLAGLSSISQDVYEAADLDGVNWFQKFTKIELPLILTQVRINLIMMVIVTLKTYGQILIILGDSGGPNGVALVPGLYMFKNAFVEGYAGKACAVGLVLFAFILILTEVNNRYVRVEK